MLISPMRHLAVAQAAQVLPEHEYLAVGGAVHRGDQMQQRGFARAGRPHQRDELAAMNGQVDFFQCDDVKIIADEFLGKLLGFDHCFGHNFCSSLKKTDPATEPQSHGADEKKKDAFFFSLCVCGASVAMTLRALSARLSNRRAD